MTTRARGSGILLHITSLPSDYGIGDLGSGAYRFADFLFQSKQKFWQILPVNPTDGITNNSPYSSVSSFAGNPLLISPELLVRERLLSEKDLQPMPLFSKKRVHYPSVITYKEKLLKRAFAAFRDSARHRDFERFRAQHAHWIEDYALFMALKAHFHGAIWCSWPEELRDREPDALASFRNELADSVEREVFFQYLFFNQWLPLKEYCNKKRIRIIGDIPIYVSYDSADVWTHPELFDLTEEKKPSSVAGVPPDYFSKTGQRWGNPLYKWDILRKTGYDWWFRRIGHNLKLCDIMRIDHFRGFVSFWEIPAHEETAVNGRWVRAPAEDFFTRLLKRFAKLPIIAEDLGIITDDVREAMRHFGFPGMKVLLFAFGEDNPDHPYLIHNFIRNCVVYTGTHDNNTVQGWLNKEAKHEEKERLFRCLGEKAPKKSLHWSLIRLAMKSVANIAIVPMQDILGLGEEARMNVPATTQGNWEWRVLENQMSEPLRRKLSDITVTYSRG